MPGRARRRPAPRGAWILPIVLLAAAGAGPAGGEARVFHALIDPEGLPALHNREEGGRPKMWLPQLRVFDSAGRPLWTLSLSEPIPSKRFKRQLEEHIARAEPLAGERSLEQEARYFLRRGGLPINLTTLPATDLTVVEYWTNDCSLCSRLSRDVDRFFAHTDGASVKIIRVFIDLGDGAAAG